MSDQSLSGLVARSGETRGLILSCSNALVCNFPRKSPQPQLSCFPPCLSRFRKILNRKTNRIDAVQRLFEIFSLGSDFQNQEKVKREAGLRSARRVVANADG